MRRLILLALALVVALVVVNFWQRTAAGGNPAGTSHGDADTVRVYFVAAEPPLDFSVSPSRNRVKLLVNATLENIVPGSDLGSAFYSVRYQVLDAAGVALDERTYYHRLQLGWRSDPDTAQPVSRRRLAEHQLLTPSDTNLMYVDLTPYARARTLRINAGPASHAIAQIAVRPYVEELRTDDAERRWLRLHKDTRAEMAKANVFDDELLTRAERASLLRQRWRPLVPIGVEGEDYDIDVLYDTGEDLAPPEGETMVSAELIAAPGHALTFPILNQSNALALEFAPLQAAASAADVIDVRWYGRTQGDYLATQPSGATHDARMVLTLPRGLLEVRAGSPTRVRAIDTVSGAPLTPLNYVVPAYELGPAPVVFDVHHASGAATPVRLDVRSGVVTQAPRSRRVRYEAIDHAGATQLDGYIDIASGSSQYDVLLTAAGDAPVSDAAQQFLLLPGNVEQLRIEGDEGLFATAYNRPPTLTRAIEIPESLFGGAAVSELRPAWFILLPNDEAQLRTTARVAFVETQVRPPDRSEDAAQEDYDAQRLLPVGAMAGRLLLEAKPDNRPVREIARPTTYIALNAAAAVACRLASTRRDGRVLAHLIFAQADPTAQRVTLTVNGKPFATIPIRGESGRVALPALPEGLVRISFSARPATQLFLSHAEPAGATAHARLREQIAYPLTEPLTFVLERRYLQDESVSVRLYGNTPARVVLEVALTPLRRGMGKHPDWTFERARYDVLLEPSQPVLALDTTAARLDHLGYFFVPIRTDVPAGNYQLRLRQVEGPPALVSVVRFAAGDIDASAVVIRTQPEES